MRKIQRTAFGRILVAAILAIVFSVALPGTEKRESMINVEVETCYHRTGAEVLVNYIAYHRSGMQRGPDEHWNSVSAQWTDPV